MKFAFCIGVLVAWTVSGTWAYSTTPAFDAANEEYQSASSDLDLLNAARLYRLVIDGDGRASELAADAACNLGSVLNDLGRPAEALSAYREAIELNPSHADAHFNLGVLLQDAKDLDGATSEYQRSIDLDPRHYEAQSNLASIHHANGQYAAAAAGYLAARDGGSFDEAAFVSLNYALGSVLQRLGDDHNSGLCGSKMTCAELAVDAYQHVLSVEPSHALANHAMAALASDPQTKAAPREYVSALFDSYADTFETSLQGLSYTAPAALARTIEEALKARGGHVAVAVDAGCGTGLLGPLLRDLTTTLVGVDLSAQMVAKAEARKIYDRLMVEDVTEALTQIGPVSLVAAADVLVYMGDLENLFNSVAAVLAQSKGIFAFTTELLAPGSDDHAGFLLQKSGRFAHTRPYLEAIASAHGFKVLSYAEVIPRLEMGKPIQGQLIVLAHKGNGR
jgi:predicted TPR repeat methyltransferase